MSCYDYILSVVFYYLIVIEWEEEGDEGQYLGTGEGKKDERMRSCVSLY